MKREVVVTEDGSSTIYLPEKNLYYHSHYGAITESKHVFMRCGWDAVLKEDKPIINILEIGFGTGLNAWLTLLEAQQHHIVVNYYTVENNPLIPSEYLQLNYADKQDKSIFIKLHEAPFNHVERITAHFNLYKINKSFSEITSEIPSQIDLIYFDAFAPDDQPELWQTSVFEKLYDLASKGCIMTTFCSKGQVRRNMNAAGWKTERLPGPPHKREILRAVKTI